ncbi:hypothetical protein LTR56_004008 [Elasticomyces elasticus]|nr:hypothetical protein LTR22_023577 [Elasticomyces elasticus]KAK3654378.1 hypothetical protein LTR56_004008 [Elasticomyces elasticus]KAK4928874.1 hypothetical protein LTR49_004375 [Elasticomyces elasticus]KAK5765460.1 hypothetical protein LTS12_004473 [Elasticomyces elasticus]
MATLAWLLAMPSGTTSMPTSLDTGPDSETFTTAWSEDQVLAYLNGSRTEEEATLSMRSLHKREVSGNLFQCYCISGHLARYTGGVAECSSNARATELYTVSGQHSDEWFVKTNALSSPFTCLYRLYAKQCNDSKKLCTNLESNLLGDGYSSLSWTMLGRSYSYGGPIPFVARNCNNALIVSNTSLDYV